MHLIYYINLMFDTILSQLIANQIYAHATEIEYDINPFSFHMPLNNKEGRGS